jgi:ketosteroid isomerase-like protein
MLRTIFHKDMIWPLPPNGESHDLFWAGHHDYDRWTQDWQELFKTHKLIHDRRKIRRIAVTPEGDGAFAVVDVDTLWRDDQGRDCHWRGRACKVYSKVGDEWKLTMHTGLLDYDQAAKATPERPAKRQLRAAAR